MIKRAMISGLSSTGVDVADLRVIPAAVARHLLKSEGYDGGVHVGVSPSDPEAIRIQFFEPPGIEMSASTQKEVEKHFTRGEIRRVASTDVGRISYPARARETYASDLLSTLDVEAIRARQFRIVVDYGFSAASYVLPLVLEPLGVEVVAAHAFPNDANPDGALTASMVQAKRLVTAIGANLGVVFDRPGERVYLVDEQAREIPVEQALLLYLSLIGSNGRTGRLAFPVTSRARSTASSRAPASRSCAPPRRSRTSRAQRRGRASSSAARSEAATSSRSSCPATTPSRAS